MKRSPESSRGELQQCGVASAPDPQPLQAPRAAWGRATPGYHMASVRVHGRPPCSIRMSDKVREGVGRPVRCHCAPQKPRHGSHVCFSNRGPFSIRVSGSLQQRRRVGEPHQHTSPCTPDSDVPPCSGGWARVPAGVPHAGGLRAAGRGPGCRGAPGSWQVPPAADSQKANLSYPRMPISCPPPLDLAPRGVRGHRGMFWLPRSCNPFVGLDKADWLSGSRAIREVNEGYREMLGHGAEAECVPGHQGPRWLQGLEESSEASGGWRHVPVPRGGDWAWGASWPRASQWASVSGKTPEQSGSISNVHDFPVTVFLCLKLERLCML